MIRYFLNRFPLPSETFVIDQICGLLDRGVEIEIISLIKGDYKIVMNREGGNAGRWHLYNIAQDPGEVITLEDSKPKVFADLLAEYASYAEENGIIEVPAGYQQLQQVAKNGFKALIKRNALALFGLLVLLIVLFVIAVRFARKLTGPATAPAYHQENKSVSLRRHLASTYGRAQRRS